MVRTDVAASRAGARIQAYGLPILAVTGFAREARLAAGPGIVTIGAGANPVRLRAMLDARTRPGCRAAISIGVAGGLDPMLQPGDIVIATSVACKDRRDPIPSTLTGVLANQLSRHSNRVILADLVGVDAPALTPAAKSLLWRQTGAVAVDMESHVAAAFANKHRLPFAAIRVVCDPAHRSLPPFVTSALRPNGKINVAAVVGALAARSVKFGDLVQLAQDSRAAFKSLRYCRLALSQVPGDWALSELMAAVSPAVPVGIA